MAIKSKRQKLEDLARQEATELPSEVEFNDRDMPDVIAPGKDITTIDTKFVSKSEQLMGLYQTEPIIVKYTITLQDTRSSTVVTVEANALTDYTFVDPTTIGFTAPADEEFADYNTNSTGTGVAYRVGRTVSVDADITYYLIWVPIE